MVVDRNLFAWSDVAQGHYQNMLVNTLHVAVGFTGMVYVVSAITAFASIQTPMAIDITDTQTAPPGAAIGLSIRDSLARILSYLFSPR